MSVYLYEGKPWRFIVTNRSSQTITMLDHVGMSRSLNFTLNAPAMFDAHVPSDDPRVNILFTDGEPYVEEGTRLLYGFRQEGTLGEWEPRFGGKIELLEDATRTEDAQTHITAWDPWRYLYSRSCNAWEYSPDFSAVVATNIPAQGYPLKGVNLDEAIRVQLNLEAGLDPDNLTPDWSTYGLEMGTFETIPSQSYVIPQGTSIGEFLQQITNYGYCDIVIDPVYDPVFKPGIVGSINVYAKAGQYRPGAIFSWDKPGRSLVGASRLKDGAKRANRIVYYGGMGGAPLPVAEDTLSQAQYGTYEERQFFPGITQPWQYAAAQNIAADEVDLRKEGMISIAIDPAPARAPRPLLDYALGDWMPVYWSNRMREEALLVQRVVGIPIELSDDGVETVRRLLVIVSDTDQPDGYAGGAYLIGTGGAFAPGASGNGPSGGAGSSTVARRRQYGYAGGFITPFTGSTV